LNLDVKAKLSSLRRDGQGTRRKWIVTSFTIYAVL